MYLSFQQITVSNSVLTQTALTIPAKATHVEIQADTQPVRYTMDNSSTPDAATGMILLVGLEAKTFLVEDLRRIKMIRGAGSDAKLNLHYIGGRDI